MALTRRAPGEAGRQQVLPVRGRAAGDQVPELIGIAALLLADLLRLRQVRRAEHVHLHAGQQWLEPGLRAVMRPNGLGSLSLAHGNQVLDGRSFAMLS